ncbi:MAG: hypothetical protein WAW85_05845, partial [Gordonia sp. (in: high G+C Gram-positive bacteria)]|uniref:hypothetical protein n=1 Tax=Gordonia sp. (in: high G+C Gram-positive bacteria) TaxID=84139 RepID=UPI003BB5E0CC
MSSGDFTTDAIGRVAYVGGHDERDERVPDGVHWQVTLPDDAVPAGPVVIFEGQVGREWDPFGRDISWEVRPDSPLILTIPKPDPDEDSGWVHSWVEVGGTGELRVAVIDGSVAPNGLPVELAIRRSAPYLLAAPDIRQLRITGKGTVTSVHAWMRALKVSGPFGDVRPVQIAGIADMAGDLPGYQAVAGAGDWEDRVVRSAPRLRVPYDPVGHDQPVSADQETERVTKLAAEYLVPWTRQTYELLADPDAMEKAGAATLSVDVTPDLPGDEPGTTATIDYSVIAALGTACADPGVARWLGRSGTFPEIEKLDEPRMF